MAGGGDSDQPNDTTLAARAASKTHQDSGELLPPVCTQLATATGQDKATSPPLTWATWGIGKDASNNKLNRPSHDLSFLPPVTFNPKPRPCSCPCPAPSPSPTSNPSHALNATHTPNSSHAPSTSHAHSHIVHTEKLSPRSESKESHLHQVKQNARAAHDDRALPQATAHGVTATGSDVTRNATKRTANAVEHTRAAPCCASGGQTAPPSRSPRSSLKDVELPKEPVVLDSQNDVQRRATAQGLVSGAGASLTGLQKRACAASRPQTKQKASCKEPSTSGNPIPTLKDADKSHPRDAGPSQRLKAGVSSGAQAPNPFGSKSSSGCLATSTVDACSRRGDGGEGAREERKERLSSKTKAFPSIEKKAGAEKVQEPTTAQGIKNKIGVSVRAICSHLEKLGGVRRTEPTAHDQHGTSVESGPNAGSQIDDYAHASPSPGSSVDPVPVDQGQTTAAKTMAEGEVPREADSQTSEKKTSTAESGKAVGSGRVVGARFPFRPGSRVYVTKRPRHVTASRRPPAAEKPQCTCTDRHVEVPPSPAPENGGHDGRHHEKLNCKGNDVTDCSTSEMRHPDRLRPQRATTDASRSDSFVNNATGHAHNATGHAHVHQVTSGRQKTRQGTMASSSESWAPPVPRSKAGKPQADKEKSRSEHHVTDKPPEGHASTSDGHTHNVKDGWAADKSDKYGKNCSPDSPWSLYRTPRPIQEQEDRFGGTSSRRDSAHNSVSPAPSDVEAPPPYVTPEGEDTSDGQSTDCPPAEGCARGDRRGDGDGGQAEAKATSQEVIAPQETELSEMARRLIKLNIPCLPLRAVHLFEDEDGELITAGKGTYATVFVGRLEGRARHVAVKHFEADTGMADILEEARIMALLQSTGFVPELLGVTLGGKSPTDTALIQDYYANGVTLHKVIYSKSYNFCVIDWLKIIFQLSRGLQAIHEKGVLLNDLKADNVLVDCRHRPIAVKFIDFGIASYCERFRFTCDPSELARYTHLAPEVRHGGETSVHSDVYSLGHMIQAIVRERRLAERAPVASRVTAMCLRDRRERRASLATVMAMLRTSLFDQIVTATLPRRR